MIFSHLAIVLATICLSNHNFATAIHKNAATLPNGVEPSAGCHKCVSSLSFAGARAKEYAVGTQIPGLPFKTKNSWAGNIPIESDKVKNGSLFFSMWGKDDVDSGEDLIIWAGNGCSSMFGLTHENGPFHIQETANETTKPNEYSWTKVAITPLYDIEGKQTGSFTEERGLTFAQIFDSGQILGQDHPATAFAAVLNLIGKKDWSKK